MNLKTLGPFHMCESLKFMKAEALTIVRRWTLWRHTATHIATEDEQSFNHLCAIETTPEVVGSTTFTPVGVGRRSKCYCLRVLPLVTFPRHEEASVLCAFNDDANFISQSFSFVVNLLCTTKTPVPPRFFW